MKEHSDCRTCKLGIEVGAKVFLKGCPYGKPGTVVRIERNRAKVRWHDLDYLASHPLVSLMEAEQKGGICESALS